MRVRAILAAVSLSLVLSVSIRWDVRAQAQSPEPVAAAPELDRTVLPIAEPKAPTYSELDARNAKPPARFEVKAPKAAPNVVIVLIDDVGFGGPSTFGG